MRHDIADFRENGVEVLIEVTHGHAIHLLFCMGKANGQDLTSLPKTLEGPVIEATSMPSPPAPAIKGQEGESKHIWYQGGSGLGRRGHAHDIEEKSVAFAIGAKDHRGCGHNADRHGEHSASGLEGL